MYFEPCLLVRLLLKELFLTEECECPEKFWTTNDDIYKYFEKWNMRSLIFQNDFVYYDIRS